MRFLACLLALLLPRLAAGEGITPGQTVERPITGGEQYTFTVDVPAGAILSATLSAHDITLDFELRAPGAPPNQSTADANHVPMPLLWLADEPASVELNIRCPGGVQGRYTLVVETHPPTAIDRELWAGQQAYQEGRRLNVQGRAFLPQANERYRAAFAHYERAGDRTRMIETLLDIAWSHYYHEERGPAREALVKAHSLSEGQGVLRANTWQGLGSLAVYMGQLETAIEAYQHVQSIAHEHRAYILEALGLNGIGIAYGSLAEHELSLKYRLEARAIIAKYGARPEQEASLMEQLGGGYARAGHYEEAEAAHRWALERSRAIGNVRNEAGSLTSLGTLQRLRGQCAPALESLQRSLVLKKSTHSRQSQATTEYEIGLCYKDMRESDQALAAFQRAHELVRDISTLHLTQWLPAVAAAAVERDRGRLGEARRWAELAVAKIEAARAALTTEGLRTTHAAQMARAFDLRADILMRLHEADPAKGLDRVAFETTEHGRARTLLEVLQDAHVDVGGEAGAPLVPTRPVTVEQLQGLLDPQTVLVEYNLGGPRSYLWALSSDTFSSHVLPAADEVAAAARTLHERWSERSRRVAGESAPARRRRLAAADAEATVLSQRLSGMLLAPIPSLDRYKRLVVVADGVLHYIPFAALPRPASAEPLIATHEVVHLPSAAVAVALRQRAARQSGTKRVAVFADPVFAPDDPRVRAGASPAKVARQLPRDKSSSTLLDAGGSLNLFREGLPAPEVPLPRLFFTRRLADTVLRDLPADQRLAAYDFTASRETVTRADLEDYRVLIFATHGILNTQYPELSGLALSMVDASGRKQDGFLRLHDIYDLKLRADLIVLGACETALGKEMRGEGLIGLSRGFLHAGATRVLASLWKVEEQATVELLDEVRRASDKRGLSYPTALREAQRRLAGRARFQSPYYWAGFVLQGDWQ